MLTIIIPTYNEENNIKIIYNEIIKLSLDVEYEICFIDDGSTDNSFKNISNLSIKDKRVRYISFSKNFGHQIAICAGINKFKNNDILMLDCDLQHPITAIPSMINKMNDGFDIVQMIKIDQGKRNFINKFFSYFFYKFFRYVSGINVSNNASDFRLIKSKVAIELSKFNDKEKFYRAMVQLVGFKSHEITYKAGERLHGQSKYGFNELIKLASFGMFGFSTFPLKLSLYTGLFISAFSFLYGFYAIFKKIVDPIKSPVGYTDVIVMVSFLGGLQLISLGLIGMYISKVLDQTRDRPSYIIEKEY